MRFRILPTLAFLLVLAACTGNSEVKYRLTFDVQDPEEVELFTQAALRVIDRRLERLNASVAESEITKDANGVTVTLHIPETVEETLTNELTAPFDVDFLLSTNEAEPDTTVEGMGGFNLTGIGSGTLLGVTASQDETTNTGIIVLHFNEEGTVQMQKLFRENVGKDIALFVRGLLVSKFAIASSDFNSMLVIQPIPDYELAKIFADDMNVGLHVTVTPQ